MFKSFGAATLDEPPVTGIVTCVANCAALLGEGPVWVAAEEALYWLDIKGLKLFRLRDGGQVESWDTPFMVGSIAPRARGFVAGTEHGFQLLDRPGGTWQAIGNPEAARPGYRFNDGKVDRQGRFWAGSMDKAEQEADGRLYRLDADRRWSAVDRGYSVTNGPAFSPDGSRLYHNDSGRQIVYAFDLAADGGLSHRRVIASFGEGQGYPDGMTVDAEGCLWIALWDGWCVRRLSPAGEVLREVRLPVQRPTSCAFGGPDLDQLFVTSARIGLDAAALRQQPQAGGLFRLDPGVTGLAERAFAG